MDAVTTFWFYAFCLLLLALAGCTTLLYKAFRDDRRKRRATHLALRPVKYSRSER